MKNGKPPVVPHPGRQSARWRTALREGNPLEVKALADYRLQAPRYVLG